ncbi:hypothetical protein Gbro_0046 [Gordonia bronchialis DSM 43247]|uniref:Uncharacterized protein n=1 Tax=Gordonia bronchialis (strain ATCC 25592 / DSM 43247 / BCRC 13721 / JCM 3198 / KCTC 3076 / NBRC 16047 / NCTC 10667) TaxID=526226 RepID=D0LA74_GORB4|nr:hypothetical protein Gbro_0046 [Gordonia bronchialis DSM 43247]
MIGVMRPVVTGSGSAKAPQNVGPVRNVVFANL